MVVTITMNYEAAGEQRCFNVTEEDGHTVAGLL